MSLISELEEIKKMMINKKGQTVGGWTSSSRSGGSSNPAAVVKGGWDAATKVIIAVVILVAVIFIMWGAVWIAKQLPTVGEAATGTPIGAEGIFGQIFKVILGIEPASLTYESLIIHLAIFVILMFAFSDILAGASTFSETTSWVIGFGLALIAGVTKIIGYIAGWLGLTAGLGALGVGIIILASIFSVVLINLGIGGPLRKWRMKRQVEVEAFKSSKGASSVTNAIKGLKEVDEAFKN